MTRFFVGLTGASGHAYARALVCAVFRCLPEIESTAGDPARHRIANVSACAMALRAFVVEAFKIPSGSMIPTLQVGDHIFVNKFTYGPAIPWTHKRVWNGMPPSRGDVMVFAFPEHPEQDFIKRVIAVPGDRLEARGGHPIINGWEVPSCRVGPYNYLEGEPPPDPPVESPPPPDAVQEGAPQ